MKPQLQILLQHQLKYTWRFPFALQFSFQGQQHTCTTPDSLQRLLESLHLTPQTRQSETSLPRTPARSASQPYTTTQSGVILIHHLSGKEPQPDHLEIITLVRNLKPFAVFFCFFFFLFFAYRLSVAFAESDLKLQPEDFSATETCWTTTVGYVHSTS